MSFDLTTQSENKPFSYFTLHTKKTFYKVYTEHLKPSKKYCIRWRLFTLQCFAVLNGETSICLQLEYGFSKHILLNEFVRGLFSFNLKSVQIPKFLKTNKQKSHMNSLTQFQELTSNLHLCL